MGENKMKKHKKRTKIGNLILTHINKNAKEYLILVCVFLIGLLLGIFIINHFTDEQKGEISRHINSYIEMLKENNQIDYMGLLKDSLIKNLGFIVLLWFIGSTVTLIPCIYIIIAFRGFALGYTISSAISILGVGKGIAFSTSALLLQNIFFIPALLFASLSGIKLYKSIVKNRKKENIKVEIYRHSLLCALTSIVFALCSLIETYISSTILNNIVTLL